MPQMEIVIPGIKSAFDPLLIGMKPINKIII